LRPAFGVVLELIAAVAVLVLALEYGPGYPFSILASLVVQFLLTFLLHCPAHYIIGRSLGIRFIGMRLGRTSLSRNLPSSAKRLSSLLVVFTLRADTDSLRRASPRRVKTMFLSGVVASTATAFVYAFYVALRADTIAAFVTALFALVYLLFNAVFSPRSGDVMRARKFGQSAKGS
jgi:hypothetical protein